MTNSRPTSTKSTSDKSAQSAAPKASRQRQARSRFSEEYGLLLNRLIELRKAAGLTQVQVAQRLGKTQSHVSMCENREREISIIDLWKWCVALGISLSEFSWQFEEDLLQRQSKDDAQAKAKRK